MAREPHQRYPSARELAEDLRRFQTGQLVGAHHYSSWELLRRFVRRYRAVLTVTALMAILLGVGAALHFRRIVQERDRAEQAERAATQRADERTLEQARASLTYSPERTLQLLTEMSPTFGRWGAVRTLAADALSQGLVLRLRGHSGALNQATFSPDGRRILTTSDDGTVRLWEASSAQGQILETLGDEVWLAVFSPDGRYVASTSKNGTVRLRELATGTVHTLQGHTAPPAYALFSDDSSRLFTGGYDGRVWAWEVPSGQGRLLGTQTGGLRGMVLLSQGRYLVSATREEGLRVWDLTGGAEPLHVPLEAAAMALAASPRADVVAVGYADGRVGLWDAAKRQGHLLMGPEGLPRASPQTLAFSPDGRLLAAQWRHGTMALWEVERPGSPRVLEQTGVGWGLALTFSPDGRWLAAGGTDGKARLWETATLRGRLLHGARDTVSGVAFSPDSQWLLTASHDGVSRMHPVMPFQEPALTIHQGPVLAAAFEPSGHAVLSAGSDGWIRLSHLEGGARAEVQALPSGATAAFLLDPGTSAVAGAQDGAVVLWDGVSQQLQRLRGPEREIKVLTLSADGARVAAGDASGAVWLWGPGSDQGKLLGSHPQAVRSLAFSPEGRLLASGDQEGSVSLWEVAGGQGRALHRHQDKVQTLAFSPDGRYLASGSSGHTVWLEPLGGGQGRLLMAGGAGVRKVLFSRDGETLLSASFGDNTLRRWNVRTGEPEERLHAFSAEAQFIALSPNGERLASASMDGTVRLWDLESGESRVLRGHTGPVIQTAFSPDGTRLVSAGEDGTVRVWPDDLPLEPPELRAWLHRAAGP